MFPTLTISFLDIHVRAFLAWRSKVRVNSRKTPLELESSVLLTEGHFSRSGHLNGTGTRAWLVELKGDLHTGSSMRCLNSVKQLLNNVEMFIALPISCISLKDTLLFTR